MSDFYQDIITQKSWKLLKKLKKGLSFILIGGWAVYLYSKALKSKDIDLIIDYDQLEKLKQIYDVTKNDRLQKYEIKQEGVDIDIYLPHYSNLALPAEKLFKHTEKIETFTLLKKEILLITKQKAFQDRKVSIKGQKDKIDIISLVFLPDFDFNLYLKVLKENNLLIFREELKEILKETKEINELHLSQHSFSRKKKIRLAKNYLNYNLNMQDREMQRVNITAK